MEITNTDDPSLLSSLLNSEMDESTFLIESEQPTQHSHDSATLPGLNVSSTNNIISHTPENGSTSAKEQSSGNDLIKQLFTLWNRAYNGNPEPTQQQQVLTSNHQEWIHSSSGQEDNENEEYEDNGQQHQQFNNTHSFLQQQQQQLHPPHGYMPYNSPQHPHAYAPTPHYNQQYQQWWLNEDGVAADDSDLSTLSPSSSLSSAHALLQSPPPTAAAPNHLSAVTNSSYYNSLWSSLEQTSLKLNTQELFGGWFNTPTHTHTPHHPHHYSNTPPPPAPYHHPLPPHTPPPILHGYPPHAFHPGYLPPMAPSQIPQQQHYPSISPEQQQQQQPTKPSSSTSSSLPQQHPSFSQVLAKPPTSTTTSTANTTAAAVSTKKSAPPMLSKSMKTSSNSIPVPSPSSSSSGSPEVSSPSSSPNSSMSQFPISTIPCKYFVNGYCKNGDKCAFSHDPTMDIKNNVPVCKFYASGTCRKGRDCPFIHEDVLRASQAAAAAFLKAKQAEEQKREKEDKVNNNEPNLKLTTSSNSIPGDELVEDDLKDAHSSSARERKKKKKKEDKEKKRLQQLQQQEEKEREKEKEREREESEKLIAALLEAEKETPSVDHVNVEKVEKEETKKSKKNKQNKKKTGVANPEKFQESSHERTSEQAEITPSATTPSSSSSSLPSPTDHDEVPQDEVPDLVTDDEEEENEDSDEDEVPPLVTDDEEDDISDDDDSSGSVENELNSGIVDGEKGTSNGNIGGVNDNWIFYKIKYLLGWYSQHNTPTAQQIDEVSRVHASIDHYEVLRTARDSDGKKIKRHYLKIASILHPDRNHASGAEEAFNKVTNAYRVLSDSRSRLEYDIVLRKDDVAKTHSPTTITKHTRTHVSSSSSLNGVYPTTAYEKYGLLGWSVWKLLRMYGDVFSSNILLNIKLSFKSKSNRQTRWCDACRDYHDITNEEGEIWEDNNRIYFRRDGIVHDVTDLFSKNGGNVTLTARELSHHVGTIAGVSGDESEEDTTEDVLIGANASLMSIMERKGKKIGTSAKKKPKTKAKKR